MTKAPCKIFAKLFLQALNTAFKAQRHKIRAAFTPAKWGKNDNMAGWFEEKGCEVAAVW